MSAGTPFTLKPQDQPTLSPQPVKTVQAPVAGREDQLETVDFLSDGSTRHMRLVTTGHVDEFGDVVQEWQDVSGEYAKPDASVAQAARDLNDTPANVSADMLRYGINGQNLRAVQEVARKRGLTLDLAAQMGDEVAKREQFDRLLELSKKTDDDGELLHPILAHKVADPAFSKAFYDDAQAIADVEEVVGNARMSGPDKMMASVLQFPKTTWELGMEVKDAASHYARKSILKTLRDSPHIVNFQSVVRSESMDKPAEVDPAEAMRRYNAEVDRMEQELLDLSTRRNRNMIGPRADSAVGQFALDTANALTQVGAMLGISAATGGAGLAAYLGTQYLAPELASRYESTFAANKALRDAGVSDDTDAMALGTAAVSAVAQASLDMVGLGETAKLLAPLKGGAWNIVKEMAKREGRAALAEGGTEAGQNIVSELFGFIYQGQMNSQDSVTTAGQFAADLPRIFTDSAYQGLVGAVSAFLVGAGKVHQLTLEASRTQHATDYLNRILAIAKKSKSSKDAPGQLSEVMRDLGVTEKVRIDADKLMGALQQSGSSKSEVEAALGVLRLNQSDVRAAAATGGEVTIDLADAAPKIAHTPMAEVVALHGKVGDNKLSQADAMERMEAIARGELPTELADVGKEVVTILDGLKADSATNAEIDRIRKEMGLSGMAKETIDKELPILVRQFAGLAAKSLRGESTADMLRRVQVTRDGRKFVRGFMDEPMPSELPSTADLPGGKEEAATAVSPVPVAEVASAPVPASAPAPVAAAPATPKSYATEIHIPGGEKIAAQYQVVELSSITPSHNPQTFFPNQQYPAGVQERNYESDENLQAEVSRPLEAGQVVNNSPLATSGAPIVGPDGVVYGGNGRTMRIGRAYKQGQGGDYKAMLEDRAAEFGLDPATVAGMSEPVLIRRLVETPANPAELSVKLNQDSTLAKAKASEAAGRGRFVGDKTFLAMQELGDDETISAYADRRADKIMGALLEDGVVAPTEKSEFYDERINRFTSAGKNMLEGALLGAVVADVRLLDNTPSRIANKLAAAGIHLVKMRHHGGEWDLSPVVRDAIIHIANKGNLTWMDYAGQIVMFPGEFDLPKEGPAFELAKWLDAKTQAEVRRGLEKMANALPRDTATGDLFAAQGGGSKTAPEAFAEMVGVEVKTFNQAAESDEVIDARGDESFANAVAVLGFKKPPPDTRITVGRTPALLRSLGIPDLPLVVNVGVLNKATNKHTISRVVMRDLPKWIRNPVAVFRSVSVDGAAVVLTEIMHESGPVVVAIHIDRESAQPGEHRSKSIRVNKIASIHDKDTLAGLREWIAAGKTLWVDAEKGPAWSQDLGITLPKVGTEQGQEDGNISGGGSDVNPQHLEQAAWHGSPVTLHQFAGPSAQTADIPALRQAERMEADGISNEDIRKTTGWFRGMDKRWRFEIDDSKAKQLEGSWGTHEDMRHGNTTTALLGDVLDHPDLFAAYPQARGISVRLIPGKQGASFVPPQGSSLDVGTITVGYDRKTLEINKPALLHEIQHFVQETEGFAKGGQPEQFAGMVIEKAAEWDYKLQRIDEIRASDEFKQEQAKYEADGMSEQALAERNASPAHDEYFSLVQSLHEEWKQLGFNPKDVTEEVSDIRGYSRKLTSISNDIDAVMNVMDAAAKGDIGEQKSKLQELDKLVNERRQVATEMAQKYRTDTPRGLLRKYAEAIPFNRYSRLAGEIEARDSAARATFDGETRGVLAPSSQTDAIVVFNHGTTSALEIPVTFAHGESVKPRASVDIYPTGEALLKLTAKSDRSSFLHESAHIYLETLCQLVEAGQIAESAYQDWNKIVAWLGVKDGKFEAEHHEKFAKGFEAYLMEGKAPAPELRGAFRMFRQWLTDIYRNIKSLGVDLNDDIRGVFDRMLASEDEINAAASVYGLHDNLVQQFLDDGSPEAARAKRTHDEMLAAAQEQHVQAVLREWLRAMGGKKALRERAEAEVNRQPVYAAMAEIKRRGSLGEGAVGLVGGSLAANKLRELHGKRMVSKTGVVPLAEVAALNGFTSERALLEAMLTARPLKEAVDAMAQKMVDDQTAAFREESKKNAGGIDLSEQALATPEGLEYWAAVASMAARRNGKKTPGGSVHAEALRTAARAKLAGMSVKEATKPKEFMRRGAKFNGMAVRAAAKGDFKAAEEHWRKAALNFAMASEAVNISKKAETMARNYAMRKADARLKNVEDAFRAPLVQLFYRYGWRKRIAGDVLPPRLTLPKVEKVKGEDELNTFREPYESMVPEWMQALEGPELAPDAWRSLTVAQLTEMGDVIEMLFKHGSGELDVLKNEFGSTVKEQVNALADALTQSKAYSEPDDRTIKGAIKKGARKLWASMTQQEFIADEADGFALLRGAIGPNTRLYNTAHEAQQRETVRLAKMGDTIRPVLVALRKAADRLEKLHGGKTFQIKGLAVPEAIAEKTGHRSWDASKIIAACLNMGNDANLYRLTEGYHLTPEQVDILKAQLTAEEWQAVQGVWDSLDLWFGDLDAAHFQATNRHVKKEKAQALTVTTADGKQILLAGGYYPLRSDARLTAKGAEHAEIELIDRFGSINGSNQKAVRDGMTKGRVRDDKTDLPAARLPVLLDFGQVLGAHLKDTAHYIEYVGWVREVDAVTRDADFRDAYTKRFGRELYDQLRKWVGRQARPEKAIPPTYIDALLEKSRNISTVAILGFRVKSAVKQRLGYFQTISELAAVGGITPAEAASRFMRAMGDIGWQTALYGGMSERAQEIAGVSKYMAERAEVLDRDVRDAMKSIDPTMRSWKVAGREFTREDFTTWAMALIKMNDAAVSFPTWLSSYDLALEKELNGARKDLPQEERQRLAVEFADGVVRRSQASGLPADLSAAQAAGGMSRLFTMFMSASLQLGNRLSHRFRAWQSGAMTNQQYITHVVLEVVAPVFTMAALATIAYPDDEEPAWTDWLIGPVEYAAGTIPVFGNMVGGFRYGFSRAGATSALEVPVRGLSAVADTARGAAGLDAGRMARGMYGIAWTLSAAAGLPVGNPLEELVREYKKMTKEDTNKEGDSK